MGKFKMPTVPEFLQKKNIYGPKKDPVWVFLEKEMFENISKKPYNEKVGNWLAFFKDLKWHLYCEEKKKERRLKAEAGPAWYCELSSDQREVLDHLKDNIHQDLLEDLPVRIRKSLSDLGLTLKIPKAMLMKAMNDAVSDPGVFIWNLYSAYYKRPPSELRPKYDINAMILMSSLVFIDFEECVQTLDDLTHIDKMPPSEPPKKKYKYYQPNIKYDEYLQKMHVPLYSTHSSGHREPTKAPPIGYKFRLRSEKSYERLCKDRSFLDKRKDRNKKEKLKERVCNYKFWEPPSTLRNTDPKMVDYVNQLRMLKKKPRMKHKSPYDNVQYLISGVGFRGGKPHYILSNVGLLPTGYIPIHGGIVNKGTESITVVHGFWNFPREVKEKCDDSCDCITKWEGTVMDYLKKSKCKCGHLYDYYHEGKSKEKYFYQTSKHSEFWFDEAKIYQMDPTEDFIKDTVKRALESVEHTPEPSMPTICPSGLKEKELLGALLADVSDTALLIPHLPQANLLNNLQEWVRKRVKGKIDPKQDKKMTLKTQRRWLDLKHMDFRSRAYRIPFSLKQLEHMKWSHRGMVQTLFEKLLNDFITRNRMNQLNQTRLFWSTMKYDSYPNKAFLDTYFTYMPGRMKDTFLINPYSSELTPKHGGKTCPL